MNKYHARQVKADGYTFASKMEFRRYEQLKLLLKAGEIENLEVHPKYEAVVNGVRVCNILLDFRYYDKVKKEIIAEDTKGYWNPLSKLKFKLLRALYPNLNVQLLTAK